MNTQYTRKSPLVLMAAASFMMGAVSSASAAPIGVTVNGSPIAFGGTPPTQVSGSVLVPLRGVFEALGASVDYNVYAHTITAKSASSTIVLPVGSTSATVNGQTQTLSQPAQVVDGTTLVPLRFVAQALGAYVDWHAATSTVEIRTNGSQAGNPTPTPTPTPTPDTQPTTVSGDVSGVYQDTNPPRIAVNVDGQDEFYPVGKNAVITRTHENGTLTENISLNSIKPGMLVTVKRRADGVATRISASYDTIRGTVRFKGNLSNGSPTIILTNGTTVELMSNVAITLGKSPANLSDIKPGQVVSLYTNPRSNMAFGLNIKP